MSSYTGTISFDGRAIERLPAHQRTRLGLVRTFEIPLPLVSMTVLENLTIPLRFAAGRRSQAKAAENDIEQALRFSKTSGYAIRPIKSSSRIDAGRNAQA